MEVIQDVHEEHSEYRAFRIQPGIIDTVETSRSKTQVNSSYYCLGVDFCDSTLTYIPFTVDLPAKFSVWLASSESDFVRGRMLMANWHVDDLKAKKNEILKGDLLKLVLCGWL